MVDGETQIPLEVDVSTVHIFVLSTLYSKFQWQLLDHPKFWRKYQCQLLIIRKFDWNINANCWSSEILTEISMAIVYHPKSWLKYQWQLLIIWKFPGCVCFKTSFITVYLLHSHPKALVTISPHLPIIHHQSISYKVADLSPIHFRKHSAS